MQASEFAQNAYTSTKTGNGKAVNFAYVFWQDIVQPIDSDVGNLRWNKWHGESPDR